MDPGGEKKVVLEERHFRRIEKLEGNEEKWEKWWFDMTTAVGGVDQELERVMEALTDLKTKVETEEDWNKNSGREDDEWRVVHGGFESGDGRGEYGSKRNSVEGEWQVWF